MSQMRNEQAASGSLIDESISNTTASHLRVPPMSRCVTAPETLGFEQAGPYEPITRRLKNILDEYKEGAGVFKELIQNADDAGATEVKFLVDWRQHPVKKLLAEGMKESQGPALLAYNNAVFTKDDFENINKLAGATKKEDLDKIGRFGLGFNSVYHFTDTPSFVSSNYAVFFDPDTKHLGHFILNPSHPGIKLNLAVNRNTLLCYPDQFQPYQGIFDCDVNGDTAFNFGGTLFRFPFRRGPSEICDKQYNERDVKELLESFKRIASSLLLNTQNVQHVSVWELDRAKEPSDMQMLTKVEKKILPDSRSAAMTTFLHDCAIWSSNRDQNLPQCTKIISISQTMTDLEDEQKERTEYWLQCDRMGDAESLEMAASKEGKQKGLLSCAGVAVNLNASKDSWKIKRTDGEAFCFLPLSISTGLPVHVNGYFAVTSNRRGIWEQTAAESQYFQPVEARWNKALMKDGIAKAYLQLLKEAKRMTQEGNLEEYSFCSLWPNPDCLQSQVWKPLIIGVYTLIASSSMKLLKSGEDWHSVTECIFPDDELKKIPGSLDILHGCNIVDLPKFARNGFCAAGCGDQIKDNTLTQEAFLTKFFFPNIKVIRYILRNKVVCHIIDECLGSSNSNSNSNSNKKAFFKELLSSNACIPCSADHEVLARPKDLVHPRGAAASLYSPCDNKMPVGDCFLEPKRLLELQNCGMTMDVLNWNQIFERAKSVKRFDYDDGLKRISALVHYLNQVIDQMLPCTSEIRNKFASLPIFPIMAKPKGYMFPWKGDIFDSQTMLPSTELFGQEYVNVIGALGPVLDESEETGCGRLNQKVRWLFRLSDRKPSLENVINQLQIVYEHFQKSKTSIGRVPLRQLNGLCLNIYKFLDTFVGKKEEATLIARLEGLSWILLEDHFVKSTQLAFKWNGNGAPYLYRVPTSLTNSHLLVAAGVKATFDVRDFLSALNHMKAAKKDERLDDVEFKVSKVFLDELNGVLDKIPKDAIGCTPMPDRDRVLRPARELVINDTPWMVMDKEMKYVHNDISINLAHALGARDIRSKSLEDISRPIGQPFGQNELLTDRLANILKSYPCDFGILKELLQNADDAKATEIHFVYDPRQHGKERLFNDSWKELQGPALCVYNNRPFSEKDLEGIQRLGIGSKADSPEKTGQYGIGFNAVYHLTDCPSFITDENTLCILDPHARYAPGATKEKPGRLFGPFGESDNFQTNYRDVFPGYLGDIFNLKGSTMFRFPLRSKEMARKSLISKEVIESIDHFLRNFRAEAKEALLFLNNVKKISVSTIKENRLEVNYQVSAILEKHGEEKRRDLAAHIRESKQLATDEIERFEVAYTVILQEKSAEEKWIVQQTLGAGNNSCIEIPDGRQNGLLPRAGVAAKVTTFSGEEKLERTLPGPDKRKAFCFLPLPVFTGLPVHVNGHFALDSGRRHLWQDEDGGGFRTKWNNFMKTELIADAYVSLLMEARKHIPHLKDGPASPYFNTVHESYLGLEWYQKLFPSKSTAETQWRSVLAAVLNKIARQDVPVFPVVRKDKDKKKFKHPCNWLKSSNGFFTALDCRSSLEDILRSIGFNLISLTHEIYKNFKDVEAPVAKVTPDEVITFLSTNHPILKQLPCPIKHSSFETVARYIEVLFYCMKSTVFAQRLDGVPLLLTKDGFLRLFSKEKPVFLSAFHHLVPSPEHFKEFCSKKLTEALEPQCDELFKQQHPVVVPLKLADLATYLPFIFKKHKPWNTTCTPVFWDPDNHDQELSKWLVELWDFIAQEYSKTPLENFLEPLKSWPVLPMASRQLVPVSLSKTILDLTQQVSWTPTQKRLVSILRKLQCPEADMKLITSKAASLPAVLKPAYLLANSEVDMNLIKSKLANISAVLKPYLAYPNSIDDVMIVLDHLMKRERDISGRITSKEAELLLQFLQEDPETLEANTRNVSVLRKLPFFKTIDGRLIKLEGASAVCKVPKGIPLDESRVWMEATNYVFLEPCHSLDVIHQILGVQVKSQTSCYIDFIFPVFSVLKASTRMKHLSFIRDVLLYYAKNNEANQLKMALKNLEFVPNAATALLCKASDLYDPMNSVLQALLTKDKFPGKPFDSPDWIFFLKDIGLLQTLSKAQVLGFAKEIENQAISAGVTKQLLDRSTILTQYLLQETSFHEASFLQNISSVHFVVAHRVDKRLASVVKPFSSDKEKSGSLTCFRDAVPKDYEQLVWSSAALLPAWAVSNEQRISNQLGILQEPSLNQVVMHANNICTKFSKRTDMDLETSLRELLLEIMEEIYKYLQRSLFKLQDYYLQLLCKMPLALVENGGVFIQCKQMVFEMQEFEEQPPYLYRVPRSYGRFERLFTKLGTTEKPMPTQYADVLEEIWKGCKEKVMHKEEMRHAKQATFGFFRALKRLHCEDQRTKHKVTSCADSLKEVLVIYFPTQRGTLRPSNQLFHMYDCPQLLERVKAMKSNYELMIELPDYGFRHPEELLSYLPQPLQVNSITQVLREELHPECLDQEKKCRLDGDGECTEASRLRQILCSQQFTDGLVRICKAQERKTTIEKEMRQKIENLRAMFTIVCFENLETFIRNDSGEEIEGSRKVRPYFFKEDDGTVCLFIRHGTRSLSRNVKLCEFINRKLDGALNSIHILQNLMMVKEAANIPYLLDELGIRRDVQQLPSGLLEATPGTVIPPEEHYLLMMYEEFVFRPDEIVGYQEEGDNLESEQGKYIYARIIEKVSPPSRERKEEKRTKSKKKNKKEIRKKKIAARMENSEKSEQRENPLVGRYLIDIGTDKPEVAEVLDLYKIKRPQEVDDASMDEDTFSGDLSIVPYDGEEEPPSTSAAKPRSWEKIKKEIRQALADIMSLPKEKQRKGLKRLYLRWHPDKNPKEMEELANEAVRFIQEEFKRLSFGAGVSGDGIGGASSSYSSNQEWYGTFYDNLNRRAQQQRSSYDNYRRQRNSFRSRSSHGASFGQSSEFHTPNASMARVWIIQSRADLRSVDQLFEANDELYWLICFQCSQVVEKALKGAMYAVCGLTDDQLMSHDLIWLASELRNVPNGPDVLYLSGELRNYHAPTRYPSKRPPARPPKEVFTLEHATKAREVARKVLQILEEFIGILHI